MKKKEFNRRFLSELRDILLSTSSEESYDAAGNVLSVRDVPFLRDWELRTLKFDPERGKARVICEFYASGKNVKVSIDARDFLKRGYYPNESTYQDVTLIVSTLLEEDILTKSPSAVRADRIHLTRGATRKSEAGEDIEGAYWAQTRDGERFTPKGGTGRPRRR